MAIFTGWMGRSVVLARVAAAALGLVFALASGLNADGEPAAIRADDPLAATLEAPRRAEGTPETMDWDNRREPPILSKDKMIPTVPYLRADGVPISVVAELIQRQADIEILVTPSVGRTTVSLSGENLPMTRVLDAIIDQHDYLVWRRRGRRLFEIYNFRTRTGDTSAEPILRHMNLPVEDGPASKALDIVRPLLDPSLGESVMADEARGRLLITARERTLRDVFAVLGIERPLLAPPEAVSGVNPSRPGAPTTATE